MTKLKPGIISAAVISNTRLGLIRDMKEHGARLSHRAGHNDELNDANTVSS